MKLHLQILMLGENTGKLNVATLLLVESNAAGCYHRVIIGLIYALLNACCG